MPDYDIISDMIEGADGAVPTHQNDIAHVPEAPVAPRTDTQTDPKPAPSLRDQISSAIKGEPQTPPAASQDGRARGPDGKFVPVANASTPADAASAPVAPGQPAGAVEGAASINPPAGIDPQVFSALPAETQVSLARTMEALNERETRIRGLEPIEQLIAPRVQPWALNGMTPQQAVSQLFALSDFASTDPQGFIKYFAQQSNIDLEDVVFGDDGDPVDPQYRALQDKIDALERTISQSQTTAQQAEHTAQVQRITDFFDAKGSDGTPLRPYANEVGNDVLVHVAPLRQQNPNWTMEQVLQEAYDRACWNVPSVRAKMLEAMQVANSADAVRAQQDRAARAKAAGASAPSGVPSTPQSPTNVPVGKSVRDHIKYAMSEAGGF